MVAPAPRRSLFRLFALALAGAFAFQAVGNILAPEWLNENLGSTGTHALYELALALMAAAVAVGAGALVRAWRPVAVAAGGPLGIGLGLHGLTEIGVFAAGVVLHTIEGLLAIGLSGPGGTNGVTPGAVRAKKGHDVPLDPCDHALGGGAAGRDRRLGRARTTALVRHLPRNRSGSPAAEPPFNQHLVTDAGAGFLAVGVVLALAAAWGRRDALVLALTGQLVFTVPHLIYHAAHPSPLLSTASDAPQRHRARPRRHCFPSS